MRIAPRTRLHGLPSMTLAKNSERPLQDASRPASRAGGEDEAGPLAGRSVAVFGSSEPLPGSEAYEEARRLGRLLAGAGARVVSGGYGGVMEATSRGAREAGGTCVGVTGAFFAGRAPNPWLTEVVTARDLFERTRLLMDLSDAFIILPGKSGTIAELAFLWALDRARLLGGKPVALCGAIWPPLIEAIERAGALEPEQRALTSLCGSAEEAVGCVVKRLGTEGDKDRS